MYQKYDLYFAKAAIFKIHLQEPTYDFCAFNFHFHLCRAIISGAI